MRKDTSPIGDNQLVRAGFLLERYDVSRPTLENWLRKGFPRPIRLAGRTRYWDLREILAWEAERRGQRA